MNAEKKYVSRGLEGARRVTATPADESPQGTASPRPAAIIPPDPEVVATPTRRRFTAEDKLRILKLPMPVPRWAAWGRCFAPKASTPRT